jgi:Domain of unknown function (DUF4388)/MshEN domain
LAEKKKMGEILISMKLISEEQLQEALKKQRESKEKIGEVLFELGYITEENLIKVLSIDLGKEFVPSDVLSIIEVEDKALNMIPREACERYGIMPFGYHVARDTLLLCTHHPLTQESIDDLIDFTGVSHIEVSLGLKKALEEGIKRNYELLEQRKSKDVKEDTGDGFYLGSDDDVTMFPGVYHLGEKIEAAGGGTQPEPGNDDTDGDHFGTVESDLRPPYVKDLPDNVEFGTVDGELAPANEEDAFPGIYSNAELDEFTIQENEEQGQTSGVAGNLEEMGVPDIVQILGAGRKTRAIYFLSKEGKSGEIQMEDGRVVNSFMEDLSGEDAFYEIVTWEKGSFRIDPKVEITDRPIENSNDWLIMEGMRKLDERSRG